jgi:hypothetical protein
MDIPQKIALFKEVAANQKQPSELKGALDDGPNFIHFAVEHIVNERLAQAAANQRSFRFKVVELEPTDELEEVDVSGEKRQQRKMQEKITLTPWLPEVSQFSAPLEMGKVRQQYPKGKISIERE